VELSRRDFLKLSGAGAGGLLIYKALAAKEVSAASSKTLRLHKPIGEGYTICPYDGSGCGFFVAAEQVDGKLKVVNIEGDPDHPVNRGAACAKGASMRQLSADNPRRLTKPLYRKAGGTDWEPIEWDEALEKIAEKIKATRDANWIATDEGFVANRTEAIGCLGGAALDNEECYLLVKMARALGLVYIEHQARI
jgi:formate dehydrogenase major subunit